MIHQKSITIHFCDQSIATMPLPNSGNYMPSASKPLCIGYTFFNITVNLCVFLQITIRTYDINSPQQWLREKKIGNTMLTNHRNTHSFLFSKSAHKSMNCIRMRSFLVTVKNLHLSFLDKWLHVIFLDLVQESESPLQSSTQHPWISVAPWSTHNHDHAPMHRSTIQAHCVLVFFTLTIPHLFL